MLCQQFPHRGEDSKGQVAVGLPKSCEASSYLGSPPRSGTGESVICVAGRAGHCRGLAICGPSRCDRKCRITTPAPVSAFVSLVLRQLLQDATNCLMHELALDPRQDIYIRHTF